MPKTILSYGEILWDVLPDKIILGGAPFNFAYRVNSLGDKELFVSSLGDDELGQKARTQAESLNMDMSLVQTNRHPTGTVNVTFDANHMPDYVINPGVAYDYIQLTDELIRVAQQSDCLCFGTLIQRAETSRSTLYKLLQSAPHTLKFLDINLRKNCFSKKTVLYSLSAANILKLNDDEVMQLCGLLEHPFIDFPEFCQFMAGEFDLEYVLVTLGQFGVFGHAGSGETIYVPGYRIDLADSLGSGDAFSAAFVIHVLNGKSLKQACEFGNALGALVATTHGATAVVPASTLETLLNFETERWIHPDFI